MKDIVAGCRQLQGAVRQVRLGTEVFTCRRRRTGHFEELGRRIVLPRKDCAIIAILVVSDLQADIDWRDVGSKLRELSKGNTLFQIVDLAELRYLVGTAKSPLQFVSNTIIRFAKIMETGRANDRVRIWREAEA